MTGPFARILPDGRLHFQHGPIDLVITADGDEWAVGAAFRAAAVRFPAILPDLCAELPLLRRPLDAAEPPAPEGPVAKRMLLACWPHRCSFITPMAAVAGAVAEEVLVSMITAAPLTRVMVNNGGDIALFLAPGHACTIGLVTDAAEPAIDGTARIDHTDGVRGVATSGWRGRSQSLGIADAVTVLAATAAEADVAATLIANAVDIDHPSIRRVPATDVKDDSDLGDRLVTVCVPGLPNSAVGAALEAGVAEAARMARAGLIVGAVLWLQGQACVVGTVPGLLERRYAA